MNSKEAGYLCAGVAVGAGLAALFAPRSGAGTREYLRSKAAEGTDYAKTRVEELRKSVSDVADRGAQVASQVIDQGTKVVKDYTGNLKAAVDAGKEAYRDAVLPTPNR